MGQGKPNFEALAFVLAGLWALGASAYRILTPLEIHEIEAVSEGGGGQAVQEQVRLASWYQVQGLWGLVVPLGFTLLFAALAYCVLRGWYRLAAVFTGIAMVSIYLTGFSLGLMYLPGLAAVLLGWLIMGLLRWFRRPPTVPR